MLSQLDYLFRSMGKVEDFVKGSLGPGVGIPERRGLRNSGTSGYRRYIWSNLRPSWDVGRNAASSVKGSMFLYIKARDF